MQDSITNPVIPQTIYSPSLSSYPNLATKPTSPKREYPPEPILLPKTLDLSPTGDPRSGLNRRETSAPKKIAARMVVDAYLPILA